MLTLIILPESLLSNTFKSSPNVISSISHVDNLIVNDSSVVKKEPKEIDLLRSAVVGGTLELRSGCVRDRFVHDSNSVRSLNFLGIECAVVVVCCPGTQSTNQTYESSFLGHGIPKNSSSTKE